MSTNGLVRVGNYHFRKRKTTLWDAELIGLDGFVQQYLGPYRTKRKAFAVADSVARTLTDGRFVNVSPSVYSRTYYTNCRTKGPGHHTRFEDYAFHNGPITAIERYQKESR